MKIINIARDFSRFPGLRRRGDHSGKEFRDNLLIPALEEGDVSVELDGTRGYGPSFLDEAFGGAVRLGYDLTEKMLILISEDDYLKKEIWGYIKESKPHS